MLYVDIKYTSVSAHKAVFLAAPSVCCYGSFHIGAQPPRFQNLSDLCKACVEMVADHLEVSVFVCSGCKH